MQRSVPDLKESLGLDTLGIRIGIHTGPVVAGVIGRSKFSYDLWGDTVDLAARMESHGSVGRIHVTSHFVDVLTKASDLDWETRERCVIDVKGKGNVLSHWLNVGS